MKKVICIRVIFVEIIVTNFNCEGALKFCHNDYSNDFSHYKSKYHPKP